MEGGIGLECVRNLQSDLSSAMARHSCQAAAKQLPWSVTHVSISRRLHNSKSADKRFSLCPRRPRPFFLWGRFFFLLYPYPCSLSVMCSVLLVSVVPHHPLFPECSLLVVLYMCIRTYCTKQIKSGLRTQEGTSTTWTTRGTHPRAPEGHEHRPTVLRSIPTAPEPHIARAPEHVALHYCTLRTPQCRILASLVDCRDGGQTDRAKQLGFAILQQNPQFLKP